MVVESEATSAPRPSPDGRINQIIARDGIQTASSKSMRQTSFFAKNNLSFGGGLLKKGTNPKRARPLNSKLPIHVVVRAEQSRMRLPKYFGRVNEIVTQVARKRGVRIYESANAGKHLHLLLKLPRRAAWSAFIRELTGRLARLTRSRWACRPFTRVVKGWRKAFAIVREYIQLNEFEMKRGLSRGEALALRKLMRVMGITDADTL